MTMISHTPSQTGSRQHILSAAVGPRLLADLKLRAVAEDRSASAIVRLALKSYLKVDHDR